MAKYPYMMDLGETRALKSGGGVNEKLPEGLDATVTFDQGRRGKVWARYTVRVDGKRIGRVMRAGRGRYYYFELDSEPGTMFSYHYFSRDDAARAMVQEFLDKRGKA